MTPSLPQVIVAQIGAKMHYAVPVLLHRAGMLARLYTDTYVGPGSSWWWLPKIAPLIPESRQPAGFRRLLARREEALPAEKVEAFNWFGVRLARALARVSDWRERLMTLQKYGEEFCQLILRTPWEGHGVYTFRNAALPLLRACAARGLVKFFEQDIASGWVQYELLSVEHELWPEWEPPYPSLESLAPLLDTERESWDLADVIVCGSEFVAQGLSREGVSPEKIRVVPYGVNVPHFDHPRRCWDGRRPLRLLFVGSVSLRKGVQYLSQALEKLRGLPLECRIVGPVDLSPQGRRHLERVARLTGQVSRPDIRNQYLWADVFVFPSLCEGSATVTYEALAAGLPVIATFNTGSVVRDGEEGFIVPIRDAEAVAARIEHLYHHPDLLALMSHKARERAKEFSWGKYGERLVEVMKYFLREKSFALGSQGIS